MDSKKVIAVDFDGTLVKYDVWRGATHIGGVVPLMLGRVKLWLKQGHRVVIFTARAKDPESVKAIKEWLPTVGLPDLEVTNVKSHLFSVMYDDRAITVRKNTGVILTGKKAINEKEGQ